MAPLAFTILTPVMSVDVPVPLPLYSNRNALICTGSPRASIINTPMTVSDTSMGILVDDTVFELDTSKEPLLIVAAYALKNGSLFDENSPADGAPDETPPAQ